MLVGLLGIPCAKKLQKRIIFVDKNVLYLYCRVLYYLNEGIVAQCKSGRQRRQEERSFSRLLSLFYAPYV